MQMNVMQFNSRVCSHSARRKVLVAEASDMFFQGFQRLYGDAADMGLALRNPKTGNVTRWVLTETLSDAEHEVLGWTLKPTPETLACQPELTGYEFRIIND